MEKRKNFKEVFIPDRMSSGKSILTYKEMAEMKKTKEQEDAFLHFKNNFFQFQKTMLEQGVEVNEEEFIQQAELILNKLEENIESYSVEDACMDVINIVENLKMKPENLEKHIKEWTEENAPLGKKLGYPDCCIKEFCEQPPVLLNNRNPSKEDKRRFKASHLNGKFTGFIPCKEHAKQIVTGKITLMSLIKNRSSEFGIFPNHDNYVNK